MHTCCSEREEGGSGGGELLIRGLAAAAAHLRLQRNVVFCFYLQTHQIWAGRGVSAFNERSRCALRPAHCSLLTAEKLVVLVLSVDTPPNMGGIGF